MEGLKSFVENVKLPNGLKREHVASIVSITAATALLYTGVKLMSPKKKSQGLKHIPSPKEKYPYVGHIFSLTNTPGRKAHEWHNELGPVYQLQMGTETWIMVDDPVLAHKIFVTNGIDVSNRQDTVFSYEHYSNKGLGLVFSQPGPVWKKSRAAALSLLAPKQIANYRESVNTEAKKVVERLIKATEENGSVDPQQDLLMAAFNVIYTIGFGKRYESRDDPEYKMLHEMIEEVMELTSPKYNLGNMLPLIKFYDYYMGTEARIKKFIQTVRNPALRELVTDALAKEGPNVVKSLADKAIGMNFDETLIFMSDMLVAGTDTISVTLTWNFAILTHYPEVQARVCEEIDSFIRLYNRVPQFEDRDSLPYCNSVLKECMRFKPTTPLGVPHTTTKDLVIDGYFIPKGALIISSIESLHRREGGYYEDPSTFNPERYINNKKTMQAAANGRFEERDHFNFGWGRRICPGIYLAETEMLSTFIEVFSKCTIEPVSKDQLPDIDGLQNGSLTVLPLPYKVKFVRRPNALV